jgi:hypothetical protein
MLVTWLTGAVVTIWLVCWRPVSLPSVRVTRNVVVLTPFFPAVVTRLVPFARLEVGTDVVVNGIAVVDVTSRVVTMGVGLGVGVGVEVCLGRLVAGVFVRW